MSYIGVVLGFIGVFLLVSQKQIISQENQILGMIVIFACMLSWSYASIFVGKADLPKNSFVNTGYQMLTGGIMLGVVSLILNEPVVITKRLATQCTMGYARTYTFWKYCCIYRF